MMSVDTTAAAIEPLVRRKEESVVDSEDKRGQPRIVLATMLAVILLDQAMKWWAWRHFSDVTIDPGGTLLLGRTIGGLYAGPRRGALLDLLDVGVLSTALSVLVRHRRPTVVLVLGALMTGGWTSNLFDRLGLHYWTAPGSIRGAVDFIHVDRKYYNVADFVIAATTLLLLVSVGYLSWRLRATRPWPDPPQGGHPGMLERGRGCRR